MQLPQDIVKVKAKIENDRKVDYWKTTKWNYFHLIENLLAINFEIIDSDKHSCKPNSCNKPIELIEHTDYSCDVLYFCPICQKVIWYKD